MPEQEVYVKPEEIRSIRRLNPDEVADYWTICGPDWIASSSDNPSHPQGVWGFNDVPWGQWKNWDTTGGEEAAWEDLPLPLQRHLVWFCSPEG